MNSLLIVEDDARVADFLSRGLKAEGYAIQHVSSAEHAHVALAESAPRLILLDVMLPGASGISFCQNLRAAGNTTPILMLTAMGTLEDRVSGLRCGADDYLTKPFAFEELLARIEALIRRSQTSSSKPASSAILSVADLTFDREKMRVTRNGAAISFTAKELALLELLMNAPGRVYSRERILANVWGSFEDPLTNVVDVYIRRLRAKIDVDGALPLIKTVRGIGYKIDVAD